MLNRIIAIQAEPNSQLRLTYDDGEIITADFRPVINQGGVFAPLADPDFFLLAAIDAHGRAVEWPGELEFCADALRLEWESHEPYQPQVARSQSDADSVKGLIVVEDV